MRTAVCRSLIQDRPDTRIHSPPKEDKSSKRSEDVTSERVSDRESKKKSSKTEIEVVRRKQWSSELLILVWFLYVFYISDGNKKQGS